MFEVFKYVDKFFTSLTNYLTYNDIFIIFVGLFLVTVVFVFISTSKSYEAKLIKAIDKFNAYFIDNPHVNEDNLVAFNQKMKAKFVPKQLRKSWQQFVLYREGKASHYMSFENCVSNPIKNSSYKRDTKLMSVLAYIFSACALILNCYYCYETADLASILSRVLLCPVIILLVNFLMQIFFNVKHSAIVSDLFQNYQYFEVNIDKATETLPEYVDYEVLFDRNEIKKGIPILYSYLQKRAEEEQRELERARLKNVEHEKFNFDDQGVEASLVLERAMQEAENYIAERKKYIQDTEQINSDITQEDMNYREITKEYNRQMQVSKETFANFKTQLENASSSIEANYLKKQQQQELDRQRNLERDFDVATDRHKKVIEGFHAELDEVDRFIAESRKSLETAMKSEFSTYSGKVYDAVKYAVEKREKERFDELKNKINELEEEIVLKNKELDKVYGENQAMSEKLEQFGSLPQSKPVQPTFVPPAEPLEIKPELVSEPQAEEYDQPKYEEPVYEEFTNDEATYEEPVAEAPAYDEPVYNQEEQDEFVDDYADQEQQYEDAFDQEAANDGKQSDDDHIDPEDFLALDEDIFDLDENATEFENDAFDFEEDQPEEDQFENYASAEEFESEEDQNGETEADDENMDEVKDSFVVSTEPIDDGIEESEEELKEEVQEEKVAPRRGRPRKVVDTTVQTEKRKRGRPRKVVDENTTKPKRSVGRPRKEVKEDLKPAVKKGPGRPRKENKETKVVGTKKGPGRPRKVAADVAENKKPQGTGKRGRPRKVQNVEENKRAGSIVDIDEYLKQIDNAIAEENAKLEETQKELAKDAKLRRRKK